MCRLPAILYVETNLVMGIAKGQDPDADRLLSEGFPDVQIVIPGICIMEAFSVWNSEKKQRAKFHQELRKHAEESARDLTSVRAQSLVGNLQRARLESIDLVNNIESRLYGTIERLSEHAEILNNIDDRVIFDTLSQAYVEDPTDNLILNAILRHAHSPLFGLKLFVSRNSRDFGREEPMKALRSAKIKYFKDVTPALGWLEDKRRKAQQIAEEDANSPDSEWNLDP